MGLMIGPGGKLMLRNGKLMDDVNGTDCCCAPLGCCPCPTPENLIAVFTQLSGPPCPELDGYVYFMPGDALEPGQECHQSWTGAAEPINAGSVEMRVVCEGAGPTYSLITLGSPGGGFYLHYPGDPENGNGQLISVSCDPFRLVYHVWVLPSTFICTNETGIPQIFEIEITEAP